MTGLISMLPVFGTLGLVVGLAIAAGNGSEHVSAIFVAMGGALLISWLAKRVANDEDRLWLPTYIMGGFTAKLLSSWVRWWVLVDYYNGSGDAVVYHARGITYNDIDWYNPGGAFDRQYRVGCFVCHGWYGPPRNGSDLALFGGFSQLPWISAGRLAVVGVCIRLWQTRFEQLRSV